MAALKIMNLAEQQRREAPRDRWGRPLVVQKDGGKPVAHRRVTTFIDVLGDKTNLVKWKQRETAFGMLMLPEKTRAEFIQAHRDGDKRAQDRLAEKAMDAAGANSKREKGTSLHELSELVDAGLALPVGLSEQDQADMDAYVLATLDMEHKHVERLVAVNELGVAGTPDRIVHYSGPGPDGEHWEIDCIADLKTGNWLDELKFAMQMAVYSRGEFYDHGHFADWALNDFKAHQFTPEEAAGAYEPFEVSQDWGIIIFLPSGSAEARLYFANLNMGWEAAQLAADVYDWRRRGKKALTLLSA